MKRIFIIWAFCPGELRIHGVFETCVAALNCIQKWGADITGKTNVFERVWSNKVYYLTIEMLPVRRK